MPKCFYTNAGTSAYDLATAGFTAAGARCPFAPFHAACCAALESSCHTARCCCLLWLNDPLSASACGRNACWDSAAVWRSADALVGGHARCMPRSAAQALSSCRHGAGSGSGLQGTITQSAGTMPELGPDVKQLTVEVENISPYILHTKIGAPGRWEVPRKLFLAPNVTGARPRCLHACSSPLLGACPPGPAVSCHAGKEAPCTPAEH